MSASGFAYHIEFLKSELERRKNRNPRYSMRAFAGFLSIHPSALSRLLNGLQEISLPAAQLVLEQLEMTDQEKRLFLASVAEEKRARASLALAEAIHIAPGEKSRLSTWSPESVLASAPFHIFVIDKAKKFLFANESGARWLERSPRELIACKLGEIRLPDGFSPAMEDAFDEVIQTRTRASLEVHRTDSVPDRYYEISAAPAPVDEAVIEAIVFAVQETTHRKHEQIRIEKLANEEKRLREIAERRLRRAESLQSLAARLSNATSRAEVAHEVIRHLAEAIPLACGGTVFIMTPDSQFLEPVRTTSSRTTLTTGKISLQHDWPAARCARTRKPIWSEPIDFPEPPASGPETLEQWVSAVPLFSYEQVTGVIGIRHSSRPEIEEEEKIFILTVAQLTAFALDRIDFTQRMDIKRAILDDTLDQAPVGFLILDGQMRILKANDLFSRWAGFQPDVLTGKKVGGLESLSWLRPLAESVLVGLKVQELLGIQINGHFFRAWFYPIGQNLAGAPGVSVVLMEHPEEDPRAKPQSCKPEVNQ